MKWLQKCLVCNYKAEYEGKPEDEDIIRASCLACGHQGLFTLEEIKLTLSISKERRFLSD